MIPITREHPPAEGAAAAAHANVSESDVLAYDCRGGLLGLRF